MNLVVDSYQTVGINTRFGVDFGIVVGNFYTRQLCVDSLGFGIACRDVGIVDACLCKCLEVPDIGGIISKGVFKFFDFGLEGGNGFGSVVDCGAVISGKSVHICA